ncbi:MAG: VanZ family protein [Candidatus Acidiferrum sp.]
MNRNTVLQPERKPLAILCILAVLALLWATLWPFNPHPKNEVAWLPDANGIRFGYGGVAFTQTALRPQPGTAAATGCAIEMLLSPATNDDKATTILTFSAENNPEGVTLRQWRSNLLVFRTSRGGPLKGELAESDIFGILQTKRFVLVTISSGPQGTTFYADGKGVSEAPRFRVLPTDLYRQIVMGSSPTNFQSWQGQVRGLAVYDTELTAAEVSAHYADWITGDAVGTATDAARRDHDLNHAVARYGFSERSGGEVHSEVASAPPITIPQYFTLPRKPMLDNPVNEFDASKMWVRDVVDNIIGFMPLGFVLGGYFALSRSRGMAILVATLCGGFLSFTIEFLQYYIPRRGSGWTDVITNSTGTLLGALLARPQLVWAALRLVNLVPSKKRREATG